MKIALINASPRGKTSTSAVLLEKTKAYIGGTNEFFDIQANKENLEPAQLETLKQTEIWVLANPLYIDSLPGHLLAVLEQLEAECRENHKVYVIINCGFLKQTRTKPRSVCTKTGAESAATNGAVQLQSAVAAASALCRLEFRLMRGRSSRSMMQ